MIVALASCFVLFRRRKRGNPDAVQALLEDKNSMQTTPRDPICELPEDALCELPEGPINELLASCSDAARGEGV